MDVIATRVGDFLSKEDDDVSHQKQNLVFPLSKSHYSPEFLLFVLEAITRTTSI